MGEAMAKELTGRIFHPIAFLPMGSVRVASLSIEKPLLTAEGLVLRLLNLIQCSNCGINLICAALT